MAHATDGSSKGSLKKRHIGLAGLITVLMQYGIGAKNDTTTQKALQQVVVEQLKTQKAQVQAELEKDFVRKSDLRPVLGKLDRNLERMVDGQSGMDRRLSKIEGLIRSRMRWSELERPAPEAGDEVSSR